jgi:hypothetical protein
VNHTHNWKCNRAIRKKVVIQAWEICTTPREKFNRGVDHYRKGVRAFDDVQELLFLSHEIVDLAIEVLDYLGRAVDGDECGDVVERRVACEEARVRGSQKLLVCGLESHGQMEAVYTRDPRARAGKLENSRGICLVGERRMGVTAWKSERRVVLAAVVGWSFSRLPLWYPAGRAKLR